MTVDTRNIKSAYHNGTLEERGALNISFTKERKGNVERTFFKQERERNGT